MKTQVTAGATGGSIGLSVIAAAVGLCCVAPWAVALFGISGALALASLGPYRLWFIVAAVVLFVAAVWMTFRRRNAADAAACKPRSRWITVLFSVNVLLLLVAIFAGVIQMMIQRHLMF